MSVSIAIDLSGGDPVADGGGEAEHEEGDGGRAANGTKVVVPKTLSTRMADLSGRCRARVTKVNQGLPLKNSRATMKG
ncbi:hypothetical protein U1Q18_036731 [Sarracenia purpurea var. burkii]